MLVSINRQNPNFKILGQRDVSVRFIRSNLMPYKPVEDIPNIEKGRVNFKVLNSLMHQTITTMRVALKNHNNMNKGYDYRDELCEYLRNQLLIYGVTHNSIHILVRYVLNKKYYPAVVDAASLAREQIEKIFSITLVLSNPHKWIKQYLRGAWRTQYQKYLLSLEEHGENPRYEEFLQKSFIGGLTKAQRVKTKNSRRPETIISGFARKVLTYYWNNPVGRNPSWFHRPQALRNYVRDYFEFPTPGRAVQYIKGKDIKTFLYRWHKEYSYFSQFTHVSSGKSVIPYMSEFRHLDVVSKMETNAEKLIGEVIFTSFTCVASACTLILPHLRDGYGSRNYLEQFWTHLYKSSLLSKAFWNMYPIKILR